MKRNICLTILCLALAAFALGCGRSGNFLTFLTATPTPVPTPTPEPTPVPQVLVCGAADADFLSSVEAALGEAALIYTRVDGGLSDALALPVEGACAIIACLDGEAVAADADKTPPDDGDAGEEPGDEPETTPKAADTPPAPTESAPPVSAVPAGGARNVVYFAADAALVPAGSAAVVCDVASAAVDALSAALSYPPHLAPVRLLGLFSGKESEAYRLFSAAASDGRVYGRGTFTGDSADAVDWLRRQLDGLYAGMLDGVYVENADLALAAVSVLLETGREDAEVFCAESTRPVLEMMREHPLLLPAAAGADYAAAGRRCAARALELLSAPSDEVEQIPVRVYSAAELTEPTPAA